MWAGKAGPLSSDGDPDQVGCFSASGAEQRRSRATDCERDLAKPSRTMLPSVGGVQLISGDNIERRHETGHKPVDHPV